VGLKKKDDFHAFTIHGSEAEKGKTQEVATCNPAFNRVVTSRIDFLLPAILRADPPRPVDVVKELVHYYQDDHDSEQSRGCLDVTLTLERTLADDQIKRSGNVPFSTFWLNTPEEPVFFLEHKAGPAVGPAKPTGSRC